MLSYCPYQNVSPGKHPAVYVQAGLNDNRVAFWEPLKWVARLRATNTGSNPIMLSMKVVGGHFGATGRYGWVKDKASEYCFVLSRMGLLEQKEK
jgi:oligopeptidase B